MFGLVGESGSGKTTVARCVLGLTPLSEGSIVFDGVDLGTADAGVRRGLRREIQLVFQQPTAALDPRMTVDNIVAEPLTTHRLARGAELRGRVARLLDGVGLSASYLRRYPHELSGGQAQRVVIARALATDPRLVVLDEPTSALDIVVQAQILNLLVELRDQHGLTYLLISHDLSVVRHLSDRIGVMYLGKIVEEGPAAALLESPRHPYTRALLASTRGRGSSTLDEPPPITGEMPSTWDVPSGCSFHTRCALREALGRPDACVTSAPARATVGPRHFAACHFTDEVGTGVGAGAGGTGLMARQGGRSAAAAPQTPATASDLGLMAGSPPDASQLVTVASWQEGPRNRWAFQHVSELVPSAVVSRGSGPVLPLGSAPQDLGALPLEGVESTSTLEEFLHASYTDGFLVLQDGNVVYERYLNGMQPSSRHLLMSVSKSLCGILVGGLVESGAVDLHSTAVYLRSGAVGLGVRRRHDRATARHDRCGRVRRGLCRSRLGCPGAGQGRRLAAPPDR